jgi:hypothetical protein
MCPYSTLESLYFQVKAPIINLSLDISDSVIKTDFSSKHLKCVFSLCIYRNIIELSDSIFLVGLVLIEITKHGTLFELDN